MESFYNEVHKYPIDKIICLDETSVGSHLKPLYSRCYIGKRCVINTNNNFVFRSFTLLIAINNSKCVGKILYEKGGTTKDATTFRYSQDQRRKETKLKKYNNIILAMKTNKIHDKTVIDYENELSHYNRKTLDITTFKEYIQVKNRINHILFGFFKKELFRKLKFGWHINTNCHIKSQKSQIKKTA